MMATFTCITCRVAFEDPDTQRAHYKTDWHRYNLKRKVAELPPVTAENFTQRVLAQQAENAQQTPQVTYCGICAKKFRTQGQYDSHLHSKKHKDLELHQQRKIQEEVTRLEEKHTEKGLSDDIVLCEKDMKNMALKNIQNQAAGPSSGSSSNQTKSSRAELFDDEDSDDDEEEEVESWEGEPLSVEQCLFCDNIEQTLEENLDHMTKGHSFFIPDVEYLVDVEGLIAHLGEKVGVGNMCLWCNHKGKMFTTIRACQQHMIDKGHCKLQFDGDAALEYADFYDYRSSYPDYKPGMEDGDEDDEEVASQSLESENYQLTLPSGGVIGHRSLQRYYKQNLPLIVKKRANTLNKLMTQYKALGWTGQMGEGAVERARDLGYLQRQKARHHLKLGKKQNKFQPHFRPQVVF